VLRGRARLARPPDHPRPGRPSATGRRATAYNLPTRPGPRPKSELAGAVSSRSSCEPGARPRRRRLQARGHPSDNAARSTSRKRAARQYARRAGVSCLAFPPLRDGWWVLASYCPLIRPAKGEGSTTSRDPLARARANPQRSQTELWGPEAAGLSPALSQTGPLQPTPVSGEENGRAHVHPARTNPDLLARGSTRLPLARCPFRRGCVFVTRQGTLAVLVCLTTDPNLENPATDE